MTIGHILLTLVIGTAAGFFNTLAGGGSLLTLPFLIFLGLPSVVANGTNRIAIMIQSIATVANFRRKGVFDWKFSVMIGIPAILGAIVGSNLAINISGQVFNRILAIVMLTVLTITLWQPQKRIEHGEDKLNLNNGRRMIAIIVFFFIGMFGGFIQAGVGFIIIASLSLLTGMSLVRINSVKIFVVGIYMLFSLAVFIYNGEVNWVIGLTLAIGNTTGGILGSNFAVAKGEKWIKSILAIVIFLMAIKIFWSSI